MTMTDNGNVAPQPRPEEQTLPAISRLSQYLKDFSFENPTAPLSLGGELQPAVQINVNIGVTPQGGAEYEVTLNIKGMAERTGAVMYSFELAFAGMFRIQNVPADHVQPVLMIRCPRMLFPFAREIVATAVCNGGFAPLLLDPIDFGSLYDQRTGSTTTSVA